DRLNSGPQRGVLASVLLNQPHRTLADLGGKLVRLVCLFHGSILSKVGASSKPGAIHAAPILHPLTDVLSVDDGDVDVLIMASMLSALALSCTTDLARTVM